VGFAQANGCSRADIELIDPHYSLVISGNLERGVLDKLDGPPNLPIEVSF
jgi:hypothetical protein